MEDLFQPVLYSNNNTLMHFSNDCVRYNNTHTGIHISHEPQKSKFIIYHAHTTHTRKREKCKVTYYLKNDRCN